MDLAFVDVLEQPAVVRAPFLLHYFDRLGDPIVGLGLSSAEVFEAAQDVVEVVRREREFEPAGPDYLAGRFAAEHPPLEQVLLPAEAGGPHVGRAAGGLLVLEQTLQHVDRRAERRHRRAVLDLAVPAAVRELLTEEPVDESLDVLAEVRAGRDDVAVDARLDLAVEESVVVPWGIHRGAALPGDALADETGCPPGLIALGIEPQLAQELQCVKRVCPVVRPGPAAPLAIRRLQR